ncbi:MAG: phosphoenolpyruvate--protein phosphotransferase [Pseudomonadota bacterium]
MSFSLHGVGVSRGIAIGKVHIVERDSVEVAEYAIALSEVDAEIARLADAVNQAKMQLRQIREHIPTSAAADIASFIDTHLLMLDDVAFTEEPARIIGDTLCNAEWAVKTQRDALVRIFDEMEDAYLRTRRDDVDHVVARILRHLLRHQPLRHEVADRHLEGMIVLAEDLSPADMVLLSHHGIAAYLTEFGGPTSHTAILARSLDIPGVAGLHRARRYVQENEMLIVDGDAGVVIGEPDERTLASYRARQAARLEFLNSLADLVDVESVSDDGITVNLEGNVELPSDFQAVAAVNALGIGLYRTEFLFMNRADIPSEEEHLATYRTAIEKTAGLPITIRTADIGGDKEIEGGPIAANPALGLRGIRYCLREPSLFRPQLRAILRASADGPVRMMLPMLANISEVRQVLGIVQGLKDELANAGVSFDANIKIGGMIEVPAAATCADFFARELDFLSIGTNDLIQYALAVDRVNDEVNYLYDPLNPAVLRLIAHTIEAGNDHEIPVAMCGEMAGDPQYTRLLLGLGLRHFSVHPTTLLEIKHMIRLTDVSRCVDVAHELLNEAEPRRRRELLASL